MCDNNGIFHRCDYIFVYLKTNFGNGGGVGWDCRWIIKFRQINTELFSLIYRFIVSMLYFKHYYVPTTKGRGRHIGFRVDALGIGVSTLVSVHYLVNQVNGF